MRVCLVYDCLFPWTVGGAERWYRNLAERLVRDGHEVTYLTLRQWPRSEAGEVSRALPGVRVVVAGPRMELYAGPGRRRVLPPLVFGAGVLWHLLRWGGRYDVVHTASFPYFSLLAAAVARLFGRRFSLVVDWHEVWTRGYWEEYLGRVGGLVGWAVQRACARVAQRAFCFSRLHARRLEAEGLRGSVSVLEGEYVGRAEPAPAGPVDPVVMFAGRHIPEKNAPLLVDAFALVARSRPDLRLELFGDGPDFAEVARRIALHGLEGSAVQHGFVEAARVEAALLRATCLALPSRREGYGLVVVEASSCGTPAVVAACPDSAAVELVSEGENGTIAECGSADELAGAILRVVDAGEPLRERTREWFRRNARRLSLEGSLEAVAQSYEARRQA